MAYIHAKQQTKQRPIQKHNGHNNSKNRTAKYTNRHQSDTRRQTITQPLNPPYAKKSEIKTPTKFDKWIDKPNASQPKIQTSSLPAYSKRHIRKPQNILRNPNNHNQHSKFQPTQNNPTKTDDKATATFLPVKSNSHKKLRILQMHGQIFFMKYPVSAPCFFHNLTNNFSSKNPSKTVTKQTYNPSFSPLFMQYSKQNLA